MRHTTLTTCLFALPNVAPEEIGKLDEDARAYQIDAQLVARAPLYEEGGTMLVGGAKLDESGSERVPVLNKLVKAYLLRPLVEGSFNLIDDILEKDRCSMDIETYCMRLWQ